MSDMPPDRIREAILTLTRERGPGRSCAPMDVARHLSGDHPDQWGPLMPAIRREAVRLMKEGLVTITRKGRPVDPDDFRGVYRLQAAGD